MRRSAASERLSEFWDRMSAHAPFVPPAYLDPWRPMLNAFSAASAVTFRGSWLLHATGSPAFPLAPDGSIEALSFYDTRPLKATLEKLVDFDVINRKDVRLSLGSVNLRSGNSVYFDNAQMQIGPEHVMASGALPPGFPPVEVDGELYWDGGIVSNSPLWYIVDENFRLGALVLQVDVFSGAGEMPQNLRQVQERVKDIQYAKQDGASTRRASGKSKAFAAHCVV
ncbi:patatin-like phospholipase family protein [Cupriavidus basilensis]